MTPKLLNWVANAVECKIEGLFIDISELQIIFVVKKWENVCLIGCRLQFVCT